MIHKTQAQFAISNDQTSYIDSTSQQDIALFAYKNFPSLYFNSDEQNDTKHYKFTAILNDGSKVNFTSQINFSEDKQFVTTDIKSGSRKIYPTDTKFLIAHFDDYDFTGIPNDSCWLFRTNEDDYDKIYLYSFLPEDNNRFIAYIKPRKDRDFLVFTKENVAEVLKSDNESQSYAEKGKLFAAVKLYNTKFYGKKITP